MQRTILFSVTGLVVLLTACGDTARITAPAQSGLSPGKAAHDSYSSNYICSLGGELGSSSLYVGQSTTLTVAEPLCGDVDNRVVAFGNADVSGDGSVVTGGGFQVASATITGHADGTGTVFLSACCDRSGNTVFAEVGVTVTHAPLTVSAFGPTSPPTGTSCSYDASVAGGYPPYSYSWSTDGTLTSGSNSLPASVTFGAAGSYEVSVTVTDSHGTQASSAVFLDATTVSPQPIICSS
jgi:PKD repeat protein